MVKTNPSIEAKILISMASLVTLVATPFVNKDALIVPKVILLFIGTLYLLPSLFSKISEVKRSRMKLLVSIIVSLMLFQLLLVIFYSDSPLEQQIFGRTGRGIGLITIASSLLIFTMGMFFFRSIHLDYILYGLAVTVLLVGVYSISQSFGYDFFPWDSKTNGVIGTLGNPNFVSSFMAMAFLPAIVWLKFRNFGKLNLSLFSVFIIFALYRAESLQGFFGFILAVCIFALIWIWCKNRLAFFCSLIFVILGFLILILSSLNIGPLSQYFYKVSVQSRGDFWRSAVSASQDHQLFGIGLDSFGDYYLKYRDEIAVSHPWGEFTDSAHNYFLEFLVSGGYPLISLYVFLNILTLISFVKLILKSSVFNPIITSLFSGYLVFQAQSLISPISIPLLVWGVLISGAVIGASSSSSGEKQEVSFRTLKIKNRFSSIKIFMLTLGIFITYPYFNADKIQFMAMKTGNGDLAILSAKMYPESVIRYSVLTRELLGSGLNAQALNLARTAVNFNPNSPALWALILINPSAPVDERIDAKQKMLTLDPLNQELSNFKIVE